MNLSDQIIQLRIALWDATFAYWKNEILFSGLWWALLVTIAIAYAVWWRLTDKRRLPELLFFGSLISIVRVVVDIIGTNVVLWSYNIRETPFMPSPLLHDFTITPLTFMLAYQYSPSWSKFMIFGSIASGLMAFLFLPILSVFGFLQLVNWSYLYTFIITLILSFVARLVVISSYQVAMRTEVKNLSSKVTILSQPAFKPSDLQDEGE